MGAQTTVSKYILPDGFNFSISLDSGSTWKDVGLLAAGATLTHNFDKETINGGNKAKIIEKISNQTVALAPSALWSQDLDVIASLMSGVYTNTVTAGTLVEDNEQTIASGSWEFNKFILIENQNYNGGIITINSVTLGTDDEIVADTDYYLGQNDKGEYGIFIIDSATVTTESQSVVIDHDYTPAASNKITAGESSATLNDFIVRLRHYTDVALTTYDIEVFIYSVTTDSGLQFNFKGQNEDGLFETTVALTGNLDESRTAGDQLFSWLVANSALN